MISCNYITNAPTTSPVGSSSPTISPSTSPTDMTTNPTNIPSGSPIKTSSPTLSTNGPTVLTPNPTLSPITPTVSGNGGTKKGLDLFDPKNYGLIEYLILGGAGLIILCILFFLICICYNSCKSDNFDSTQTDGSHVQMFSQESAGVGQTVY